MNCCPRQNSPRLLADLANLERYVAETYSARSFIELLQNADDAGAKRFLIKQDSDRLICANDGRQFSRDDFHSLCRSAASDKKRGQTIGYRGIGFKSVVGMASEVHLLSESLEATFSRQLSQDSLGMDVPTPLVRIPHPLALPSDKQLAAKLATIRAAGFSTIFIFGRVNRAKIDEEFVLFDAEYLLFLRNITEATLIGSTERRYSCSREVLQDHCRGVQSSLVTDGLVHIIPQDSCWERSSSCIVSNTFLGFKSQSITIDDLDKVPEKIRLHPTG